jgi:hypothetical protein
MIDPIMIISQFGNAQAFGPGVSAGLFSHGGLIQGLMRGQSGSQTFSFTNTPFDNIFQTGGNVYSLRQDFISKLPLGESCSVFSNGQNIGWIGFGPTSGYFSGNLGSNMGSSMTASMLSSGLN